MADSVARWLVLGVVGTVGADALRSAHAGEVQIESSDVAWSNAPFLQGRGPGWAALATPWRTRHMSGAKVPDHLQRSLQRPVFVTNPDTDHELFHDDTWGSVFDPVRMYRPSQSKPSGVKPGPLLCQSQDGPRCMALHQAYAAAIDAAVSLEPHGGSGATAKTAQASRDKVHGNSPMTQLMPPTKLTPLVYGFAPLRVEGHRHGRSLRRLPGRVLEQTASSVQTRAPGHDSDAGGEIEDHEAPHKDGAPSHMDDDDPDSIVVNLFGARIVLNKGSTDGISFGSDRKKRLEDASIRLDSVESEQEAQGLALSEIGTRQHVQATALRELVHRHAWTLHAPIVANSARSMD
eukprot:SAG31_NODE_3087_length_4690_cov_30.948377_3_plen_348_part_00